MQKISTWGDFWMVSAQGVCFAKVWSILYSVFIICKVTVTDTCKGIMELNSIEQSKLQYFDSRIYYLPAKKNHTHFDKCKLLAIIGSKL